MVTASARYVSQLVCDIVLCSFCCILEIIVVRSVNSPAADSVDTLHPHPPPFGTKSPNRTGDGDEGTVLVPSDSEQYISTLHYTVCWCFLKVS